MSSHPMLSNAMHARVQRKRIETNICNKTASQPVIAPVLTQQALAAVVAQQPNAVCGVPTIRKPHHHNHPGGHHHHGHHHGNSNNNTLMIGGLDTTTAVMIAQKLFARRILH